MLRSVLLGLCLALCACQAPNPYTAASLPETAERRDYNPNDYPPQPRNYAAYRTWRWQQAPTGSGNYPTDEFRDAVAAGLERLGLRQSREGASADLAVRADLQRTQRLERYVEPYGGYYGNPYRGGMWAGGPIVRSYRHTVLIVTIELLDGADGQLIWRGQSETLADNAQRNRLYQAVREALSGFPP